MSKARNRKQAPEPARPAPPYAWPAAIVLAVLIFYWTPLTSADASIQWDAVDVHYSSQKYFADRVTSGTLPFWTPYIFCGFPFLADLQVGAFYPLNWPFFLAGVTPRAIQMELALHALLACAGAFLLARMLLGSPAAALASAFLYGLSGFFAAHSSHVGIFQTAAWLPWILYGFLRSLESSSLRPASLTGLAAGAMILAGHFQTALYVFCALALFAAMEFRRPRIALVLGIIVGGGLLTSAIQLLPGAELVRDSIRANLDTSSDRAGTVTPGALATLVSPNHFGATGGASTYTGPADITQYYFYAGLLLLPLAIAGALAGRTRWLAAVLIVPAVWYGLGPAGGFYRLIALLPAFRSIRAPAHVWFVAALGLALLGGAGLQFLSTKFPKPYLPVLVLGVLFVDLFYWNSSNNQLAYARASYDSLYGAAEQRFQTLVASAQPPLTRFHAPGGLAAFGPLNHPLDLKIETTYGYNPLTLKRYTDYIAAAQSNRAMLDNLSVTRILNTGRSAVEPNPSALPFVSFPGGAGTAEVISHDEQSYRIRYHATAESVLRVAVAWFPGWRAVVAGVESRVAPADGALIGITVPAGEGELELRFRSTYFAAGAAGSALAVLALLAVAIMSENG